MKQSTIEVIWNKFFPQQFIAANLASQSKTQIAFARGQFLAWHLQWEFNEIHSRKGCSSPFVKQVVLAIKIACSKLSSALWG